MRSFKNTVVVILAYILLCPGQLFSQHRVKGIDKESYKKLFTEANLMQGEGFTDSALRTFLLIYPRDTSNANIAYHIGVLYLSTPAHKADALPYLEKAASHVSARYRPDDPYEKSAPALAYYYLARAQHLNYQFDKAIDNFNRFKKILSKKDPRQDTADYYIQCCNNAKVLIKTPVDCKIINIGDSVNSKYPDYSPVLTADEQELLFTSRRPASTDSTKDFVTNTYYEDIWISYAKPGGGWTRAKNLGTPVNSAGNDATVSISPDGQTLLVYKDNNMGDGNIFATYRKGNKWSQPQLIDSANSGVINSSAWEPSACISPDGQTLYFVSNRSGGYGGTDIYKSTLQDDGKWGTPVNLGPKINTPYDEDAPFIHPDDSTMFFSSKGHNTMGGFDVFSTRMNASGQWDSVKNVGYPINTPDDDIYFNVSGDGKRAYYSSIQKGGYGEKDIYEVIFQKPLPVQAVAVLVGYIKSPDGNRLPNNIEISSSTANSKKVSVVRVNPITGKFLQVLRPNTSYKLVISKPGKTYFDQNFYLPTDSSYLSLSRAFFRTSIVLGDTDNVLEPHITEAVAIKDTGIMTGKISQANNKSLPIMKIQLINDKDSVIATTLTDKEGYFTITKLGIKHINIMKVEANDTQLKPIKKLYLSDKNGRAVREFDEQKKGVYYYRNLPVDLSRLSSIAGVKKDTATKMAAQYSKDTASMPKSGADFTRYFAYNIDSIQRNDADFIALVLKIATKAAVGHVTISIQASASKVPTGKAFSHSNKVLARHRAKNAKEKLENALKEKHVDLSKVTIKTAYSVQGPAYAHDKTNQVKYEKFQYVKIYIH